MLAADLSAFLDRNIAERFVFEQEMGLLENPRIADCTAANEDTIDAVVFESCDGLMRRNDVAVAEDRDVHSRVVLHVSDERPIRGAFVHLRFGAAVDAESRYADILESLSEFHDGFVVLVEAETRLHRDGKRGVLDDSLCDAYLSG